MKIEWKRMPRRGFVGSHWVGVAANGQEFSIWPHVHIISRNHRSMSFTVPGINGKFRKAAEAKAAAEAAIRERP